MERSGHAARNATALTRVSPDTAWVHVSPEPPLFEAPSIGAHTGTQYIQQFPINVPP